jgi:hypothetical protein
VATPRPGFAGVDCEIGTLAAALAAGLCAAALPAKLQMRLGRPLTKARVRLGKAAGTAKVTKQKRHLTAADRQLRAMQAAAQRAAKKGKVRIAPACAAAIAARVQALRDRITALRM